MFDETPATIPRQELLAAFIGVIGDAPEDQHSAAMRAWSDAWHEHDKNPRFLVPVMAKEAAV